MELLKAMGLSIALAHRNELGQYYQILITSRAICNVAAASNERRPMYADAGLCNHDSSKYSSHKPEEPKRQYRHRAEVPKHQ